MLLKNEFDQSRKYGNGKTGVKVGNVTQIVFVAPTAFEWCFGAVILG